MDKLRRALSGQDDEEAGTIIDEESPLFEVRTTGTCASLSWGTRIKGFIGCFLTGLLLSVLGSVCVFFKQFTLFAVLFSFGSILSLMSTCFLMGPVNQIKKMFAPTRLVATIVALLMIILTIIAGFKWHNGGLCLLFVLLQYIAMTWYSISYIPYARRSNKMFQHLYFLNDIISFASTAVILTVSEYICSIVTVSVSDEE